MNDSNSQSTNSMWLPKGRASRAHYFVVLVGTALLGSILGLLIERGAFLFGGVCLLVVAWVSLCALARRLHDLGISGWWSLVVFIPIVNVFFGLYVLFAAGENHENAYGVPSSTSMQNVSSKNGMKTSVEPEVTDSSATPEASTVKIQKPIETVAEPVEEFWALALQECDSHSMKPGVWAKAYADANGDEKIAKATYIRLRASQLQDAYIESQRRAQVVRDQELQAERERLSFQEKEKNALLEMMSEVDRAKALLPKGRCPACDAVIPLISEQCPECTAIFTADSTWKIKPLTHADAIAHMAVENSASHVSRKKVERTSDGAQEIVLFVLFILLVLAVVAYA